MKPNALKRTLAVALAVLCTATSTLPFVDLSADAYSKADIVAAVHADDLVRDESLRDTSYRRSGIKEVLSITNNNTPVMDKVDLPKKFDLRDVNGKNYVSPVKLQNPWGTCWSFGGTAAAEISLASAKDFDYNDPKNELFKPYYDFSEKHLAWFAYMPLTEESGKYSSQAGEGYYLGIPDGATPEQISNKVYNKGGMYPVVNTLYSAGIGPAFEKDFPYQTSDETVGLIHFMLLGIEITGDPEKDQSATVILYDAVIKAEDADALADDLVAKYPGYEFASLEYINRIFDDPPKEVIGKKFAAVFTKEVADWTLPESDRFSSAYYLKDGNVLPPNFVVDENMKYVYNPAGVEAIKRELINGRGVAVGFNADQSLPGEAVVDGGYMNFLDKDGKHTSNIEEAVIWAQYTYDKTYDPKDPKSVNKPVPANHAVCIVGYDDTFPKENFNDPNGTIGGDGAWIIKNSWGHDDASDPKNNFYWGNSGDGYFYLSYYDQSMCVAESFNFDTDSDTQFLMKDIDMYDFLPTVGKSRVTMKDEISMASVFTAQNNCAVRFIGVEVTSAESDVEYKVYKLNDNASSPVDGTLFAQSTKHFNYIGYHMVDIGRSMTLRKGDKYSVVVKIKDPDGYQLNVSRDTNKQGEDYYEPYYHVRYLDSGEDPARYTPSTSYSKAVVNKGESFVGSGSEWTDWADVISELKKLNKDLNNDGFEYDNFAVRSYPETEYLSVVNKPVSEQQTYKAGDVLKGVIKVKYNSDSAVLVEEMGGNFEVELTINGKQFMIGENNKNAVFNKLAKGETLEIPYEYTVTEEDTKLCDIESTARLKFMGVYLDEERKPIFPEDLTYTINNAEHKWSEWKTTAFDTDKNTSTQTRTCSTCNKTETKTTENAIVRLAGANRYETAAKISQASFTTADTVVLAYSMNYADALAGVSLATKLKAPILLTNTKTLDATTLAEIKRLNAKNVIILGGTGAISDEVKKELENNGLTTERIAGASRFGTATAIAEKLNENPTDVFFVYYDGFADALSVSPIAASKNAPIIYLSTNGELHPDTAAYLAKLKEKGCVKNAYVIGGEGVISNDMMNKAGNALGVTPTRVFGKDRFATCVAVNEKFADVLDGDMLCVATGMDFPDALAGGVYAAINKAPLFLVNGKLKTPKLSDEQKAFLKARSAARITTFGGEGAVPDSHIADIAQNSI
jgi:putative cell wall-binding protein/C1A family cysteine protease